jgi:hypothetical protein
LGQIFTPKLPWLKTVAAMVAVVTVAAVMVAAMAVVVTVAAVMVAAMAVAVVRVQVVVVTLELLAVPAKVVMVALMVRPHLPLRHPLLHHLQPFIHLSHSLSVGLMVARPRFRGARCPMLIVTSFALVVSRYQSVGKWVGVRRGALATVPLRTSVVRP